MTEDHFEKLKCIYREKGICLGLGSGISKRSGIPIWERLLCNVSDSIFGNQEVSNDFSLRRYSFETFASFLKVCAHDNPLNNNRPFNEIIREELYKKFKKKIGNSKEQQFLKEVLDKNISLKSVGSFCAFKEADKDAYTSNPNVHGIINFNIDRLLRIYTTVKFNKTILRTVERPSAGRTPNKINVYHIHGMMRSELGKELEGESPDKLIIAEEDYYNAFSDNINFINYSFLYLLREYSFLFIGLSMKDLNLRRLLALSKREISNAYLDEQSGGEKLKMKLAGVVKHYAILKDPKHQQAREFQEITLRELGVNIIWINSHDEIQDKLKDLYSLSGRWDTVF